MEGRFLAHDTPTHGETGLTVFVGDPRDTSLALLEWQGDREVERIDGRDHGAILAAASGGLFSRRLSTIVDSVESADIEAVRSLGEHRRVAGVLAATAKGATRKLSTIGEAYILDRRWREKAIVECFTRRGIRVEHEARRMLTMRCDTEPTRARSAARIAAMAGIDNVPVGTLNRLLGSVAREGRVFDVADALWRGDRQSCIDRAGLCESIPLSYHLCDSAGALLLSHAGVGSEAVASLLGMHPYAARKHVEHSRRLGPDRCARAVQAATRLAIDVHTGRIDGVGMTARLYAALWR